MVVQVVILGHWHHLLIRDEDELVECIKELEGKKLYTKKLCQLLSSLQKYEFSEMHVQIFPKLRKLTLYELNKTTGDEAYAEIDMRGKSSAKIFGEVVKLLAKYCSEKIEALEKWQSMLEVCNAAERSLCKPKKRWEIPPCRGKEFQRKLAVAAGRV